MFRRNSTRQTPRSNSLASDALNSIVSGGNNSPSPSAPSPPPPPPPQLSPSPIGPNDGRKRRVSRSQFDAEVSLGDNLLPFPLLVKFFSGLHLDTIKNKNTCSLTHKFLPSLRSFSSSLTSWIFTLMSSCRSALRPRSISPLPQKWWKGCRAWRVASGWGYWTTEIWRTCMTLASELTGSRTSDARNWRAI